MAEIAALILAAGRATRWRASGGREATKLVANWRGRPVLRWVAEAALASHARPVIVVTGHEGEAARGALTGLDVVFAANPDHAQGLSTSLRRGLGAVPASAAGAVVLLGDMPGVGADLIDALIAAYLARPGALAAAPMLPGGLGNPALLGRALFAPAMALVGDKGARGLIERAGEGLVAVPWAGQEASFDVDEAGALAGPFQAT